MNEAIRLVLVGMTGLLLGAIFFGGLWWTVRKGVVSRHPALWFLSSLFLRTVLVLVGFYFVSGGHWKRLVVCALGFFVARFIVIWLTRPSAGNQICPAQEDSHAT